MSSNVFMTRVIVVNTNRVHLSMQAVRCSCVLCVLACVCSGRSCEANYNDFLHSRHSHRLMQFLGPIQDTALLLHRENPNDVDLAKFAHRLVRVYDNFTSTCFDHHWLHALNHKLCASFVRWEEWIHQQCTSVKGTSPGNSVRCLCTGIDTLLLTCKHHVLVWANDGDFCGLLDDDCSFTHPFAGMCALLHRDRVGKVVDQLQPTGEHQSSSSFHNTVPKHTNWNSWHRKQKVERAHENVQDRLSKARKTTAPASNYTNRASLNNDTVMNTYAYTDEHISETQRTLEPLYIGALVHLHRHRRHEDLRYFEREKCGFYSEMGVRVCVLDDALMGVLEVWAPKCISTVGKYASPSVLRSHLENSDDCDIQIGWMPSVLRVYRTNVVGESTSGNSVFRDPGMHAIQLIVRSNSTLYEAFKPATVEYKKKVNATCEHWRTEQVIGYKGYKSDWFECEK